jgi:hypothetical protein
MMRRTVQVLALILALSAPATAGIMQCPVASPTPEPMASVVQQPSGEVVNPSTNDETAADSLTDTFLDLLAVVLALV